MVNYHKNSCDGSVILAYANKNGMGLTVIGKHFIIKCLWYHESTRVFFCLYVFLAFFWPRGKLNVAGSIFLSVELHRPTLLCNYPI